METVKPRISSSFPKMASVQKSYSLHAVHFPASSLTRVLPVAVGQGERVRGVHVGLAIATALLVLAALDRHLAELSGEVGRTLALIPGTALTSVYTGEVADH